MVTVFRDRRHGRLDPWAPAPRREDMVLGHRDRVRDPRMPYCGGFVEGAYWYGNIQYRSVAKPVADAPRSEDMVPGRPGRGRSRLAPAHRSGDMVTGRLALSGFGHRALERGQMVPWTVSAFSTRVNLGGRAAAACARRWLRSPCAQPMGDSTAPAAAAVRQNENSEDCSNQDECYDPCMEGVC